MDLKWLDFLSISDNQVLIDGCEVDMTKTPAVIYSSERIKSNINLLKETLRHHPFQICFALKCCYHHEVHKIMIENEIDCEVMSEMEFDIASESGFNTKSMVVNGVAKTYNELKKYVDSNISSINVDSLDDLKLLKRVARDLNKRVNVGIRIKTNLDEQIFICSDCKLGLNIDDGEAEKILTEIAKEELFDLKQVGFHMFSKITDATYYDKVLPKIGNWANQMSEKHDIQFKEFNFGGGFESRVMIEHLNQNGLNFLDETLTSFRRRVNYKIEKFIFEPGRYLISDAAIALTEIQVIKGKWIFVDVPTNFLVPLQLANFMTFDLSGDKKERSIYSIVDGSCSPSSIINKKAEICNPKIGNKLIVANCGAYTFPFSSIWYKEIPEVYMTKEQELKKIFSHEENLNLIENLYGISPKS